MSVKLLTEHHLEFLSLIGGYRDLSESTLVKMPHCWKSRDTAHIWELKDMNVHTLNSWSLLISLHRESYISVHVLLKLLNELGKRDKMRGLPSILSLFRNDFNKLNNTRARMVESIYHMILRLLWNLISAVKTLYFCYVRNVVMDVITFPVNL